MSQDDRERWHTIAVKKITHGQGVSYEMKIKIDRKVVRRRFGTAKLAHDGYARLRQSVNDGSYIPAERSQITFAAYAEEWLAGNLRGSGCGAGKRVVLHRAELLPGYSPTRRPLRSGGGTHVGPVMRIESATEKGPAALLAPNQAPR